MQYLKLRNYILNLIFEKYYENIMNPKFTLNTVYHTYNNFINNFMLISFCFQNNLTTNIVIFNISNGLPNIS